MQFSKDLNLENAHIFLAKCEALRCIVQWLELGAKEIHSEILLTLQKSKDCIGKILYGASIYIYLIRPLHKLCTALQSQGQLSRGT